MPSNPTELLTITHEGGRMTARFPAVTALTGANTAVLGRELAALDVDRVREVRLDLAPVTFLTSMALTLLIALHGRVRTAGGHLTLVNLRPTVRQVFAVTRLDRLLDVRAAGEALSA